MQRFILEQNLQRFRQRLAGGTDGETRELLERLIAGCQHDLAVLDADAWGALPIGGAAQLAGEPLDTRQIARALDSVSDPALLIDPGPGLRIIDLNEAYCDAAMVEHARVAGERLFAAFPDNPDNPGADGVVNLYASLRRVAATGQPQAMPVQRYDMRDHDGRFVERRWRMQNVPIFSKGGRLLYLLHQVEDVTPLALAAAAGLGAWPARPPAAN